MLTDFTGDSAFTGINPMHDQNLISVGGALYGMTQLGGTIGYGTIFKIMPDGTGYSTLLDFAGASNGGRPYGSLVSDGTFLYGMTSEGGTNNMGVVFKILPDGTGYSKLLDFAGAANGGEPYGSLISDGTFLYGMTSEGGTNNQGVIFKIMPDGTGYSKLLDFAGATNGREPFGSLVSDGTFLYGMTHYGGVNNRGIVFKIMPDGTGFAKLLDFAGMSNGSDPFGSLVSDGAFLYGMTMYGGTNNMGVVFKIMPNGTGYSKLLDFAGVANGANPLGSLVSDGTFLYGITRYGSINGLGVVFKIMPDGSGYSQLLNFANAADGKEPHGSLIYDGTFLYAMTRLGGINNAGVVFKVMPDGTGYFKLFDFAWAKNGGVPRGSLISDGTFLYGMTEWGGINNMGVIFKIMPDGTGFTKLLDFTGASNGRTPYGTLVSDGTYLYGMTSYGGAYDMGVVFKIMPDGTGYSRLLDFDGAANGSYPNGSLVSDGTFLYGMTLYGGTNNLGVVFRIMPDGTGYSKLLDFDGAANGGYPYGSLISDGTFLYGMTMWGGTNGGYGTIFKIMYDGTGYANLYDFASAANGATPYGSLISDGTFLYGMTLYGGTNNQGVIFKIMPDGTGYSKLFDFDFSNGYNPRGSLVQVGTFLYGMTEYGGTNNMGVVFKIMPDGTGYSKLLDFAGAANGLHPYGSLISDGSFLYGMTNYGGGHGVGTVFRYCLTMPPVNLVLSPDTVCINYTAYALTGGSPTGGTYSGPGVSAGNFDPGVAGVGLHNIIYTYADSNNCSNSDTVQIIVDFCTGIQTVSGNQSISIFPNPSMGMFTLAYEGGGKRSQIEIYNVLGEKVAQIVIPGGGGNQEIDLSDQPDGIYFLQIKTEQGEEVGHKKIIVSK